ncbi:MAG TPA: hypothetical protein VIY68_20730 [Steroidobacteraceae bacterium]
MRRTIFCATIIGYLIAATGFACARAAAAAALQCAPTPKDCVALALNAMGGRERIEAVKSLKLVVSQKVQVGIGANRMELYPLRGACTERQYMVYFPEHKLLYASDTLALNPDGSLYAPELMREVMDAVKRENLEVATVFAMHQEPVPWAKVTALVERALN